MRKFRVWHKKKAAWISDDVIVQCSTELFDRNGIEI